MKIKFLGTIAAEGGPALFCNCDYCKEALKRGGKDIRTRSQLLINDDMLVDFPADTYMHKLQYNIDMSKIKYLLVTHSHHDHFYPYDLTLRGGHSGKNMVEPTLEIYCNQSVQNKFIKEVGERLTVEGNGLLNWHVVDAFEEIKTERYEIWTLRAQHATNENALFYLIKQGDKTFLQCFDTGCIFEETYAYLEKLGVKIDVICLDCTMGAQTTHYFGHMNLEECKEAVARMRKSNYVKENTRFILTHLCHNGQLLYDDFEKLCAPYGIEIAYEGMEVEI